LKSDNSLAVPILKELAIVGAVQEVEIERVGPLTRHREIPVPEEVCLRALRLGFVGLKRMAARGH